jgi:hypothetical protein
MRRRKPATSDGDRLGGSAADNLGNQRGESARFDTGVAIVWVSDRGTCGWLCFTRPSPSGPSSRSKCMNRAALELPLLLFHRLQLFALLGNRVSAWRASSGLEFATVRRSRQSGLTFSAVPNRGSPSKSPRTDRQRGGSHPTPPRSSRARSPVDDDPLTMGSPRTATVKATDGQRWICRTHFV